MLDWHWAPSPSWEIEPGVGFRRETAKHCLALLAPHPVSLQNVSHTSQPDVLLSSFSFFTQTQIIVGMQCNHILIVLISQA